MQGSCNDRLRSVLVHSLGKVDTDFRCVVTETTRITPCKKPRFYTLLFPVLQGTRTEPIVRDYHACNPRLDPTIKKKAHRLHTSTLFQRMQTNGTLVRFTVR